MKSQYLKNYKWKTFKSFYFYFSGFTSITESSGPTPSTSDGIEGFTLTGQSTYSNSTLHDACNSTLDGIYVHVSLNTSDKREWDKEKSSMNCIKHVMSFHKSELEVELIES